MEVRSKYESPLRLEKIEIVESTFRKKDESIEHLELGLQVERSLKKISDKVFEVLLETTVSDEDEKVFVNVKGMLKAKTTLFLRYSICIINKKDITHFYYPDTFRTFALSN